MSSFIKYVPPAKASCTCAPRNAGRSAIPYRGITTGLMLVLVAAFAGPDTARASEKPPCTVDSSGLLEGIITVTCTGDRTGDDSALTFEDQNTPAGFTYRFNIDGAMTGEKFGMRFFTSKATSEIVLGNGDTTGKTFSGIHVWNVEGAVIIKTGKGTVRGATSGIFSNARAGSTIEVRGAVVGGTGAGITLLGGTNTVTLKDGAHIYTAENPASGKAISETGGNTTLLMERGAKITGSVELQDGTDKVVINDGADIAAITWLDGGSGGVDTDSLVFAGGAHKFDGNKIDEFEQITIDGGSVRFSGTSLELGGTAANDYLELKNGGTFLLDAGVRDFSIAGNVENTGGVIDLQGGSDRADDTLTITGNYAGGGTIRLDTMLNGNTPQSDKLVIEGDSSGATALVITNRPQAGAGATGSIMVIQVSGNSDGTFTLQSPFRQAGVPILVAGAWAYRLEQDGRNWYLRSRSNRVSRAAPAAQARRSAGARGAATQGRRSGAAVQGSNGGSGGAGSANGDPPTNYSPAAPAYESLPRALMLLNRPRSLRHRASAHRAALVSPMPYAGAASTAAAGGMNGPHEGLFDDTARPYRLSTWVKVTGRAGQDTPARSSTGVSGHDTTIWQMQGGVDALVAHDGDNAFIVGATGTTGSLKMDVTSRFGDGRIEIGSYGLGLNATWYGVQGYYSDIQAGYNWYESDVSATGMGVLVDGLDGSGWHISLEAGRRLALNNGMTLTPQAQLAYTRVDFDDFTGPADERVSLGEGSSILGRIGLALGHERTWQENGGNQSFSIDGIVNVYREFENDLRVHISATPLVSKARRWTGEMEVRLSRRFNDNAFAIFAEAGAATDLEDFGDSYELSGAIGIVVRW